MRWNAYRPTAFGLIKNLDGSKVVGVKLAECVIASRVEKYTPVKWEKPTLPTTK